MAADGIQRYECAVEMHALNLGVGREHIEGATFWLDHRCVVSWTDNDPGGGGKARRDALNQRSLANV